MKPYTPHGTCCSSCCCGAAGGHKRGRRNGAFLWHRITPPPPQCIAVLYGPNGAFNVEVDVWVCASLCVRVCVCVCRRLCLLHEKNFLSFYSDVNIVLWFMQTSSIEKAFFFSLLFRLCLSIKQFCALVLPEMCCEKLKKQRNIKKMGQECASYCTTIVPSSCLGVAVNELSRLSSIQNTTSCLAPFVTSHNVYFDQSTIQGWATNFYAVDWLKVNFEKTWEL